MKSLDEHQVSTRNDGFSDDGSTPLTVIIENLPNTTPTSLYEEIDDRQHTYEALFERDKYTSYQNITKYPSSHHVQHKSVSVLSFFTLFLWL